MRKLFNIIAIFVFFLGQSQITNITDGESLTLRIHYGFLNAGSANLTAKKSAYKGVPHLYVKGTGQTTGAVKAFFKVEDVYESYINMQTELPSFYVRNVKEGTYRQHLQTVFNHDNHTLVLTDKKTPANGSKTIKSVKGVQDMLSCFYFLRSKTTAELKTGTVFNMNVWIDDEMFPFQLKVVGTENLKTKFGTINALKIIPSVKSGRVFKQKEGVTMWVSNDANHIPLLLKAELAVGSLKASLDDYKNVKYPLKFTK
ncbi:DUF3108 domain-containing protein [Chryseobacterium chendengshani]|uniref:DUF3108 domain-containing protein n=1 Tax=unclassified Chryseobacterium TaxID=2593645 RepID=UPI001C63F834|nr:MULTISPECIES: DUF3108 domain-containing protein [unclassified Chryseobacterium]MBW7676280.1 DUF3108 domain-containing protein [Chryseobacterium sp. LJ756]MBW8524109.1 DUF3108 domain-containing protein [Chryseobacterium sp. LJ668]QYK17043.1 DUF3108 domain-containing protein [Chryseobacterium sp. LJ668]